MVQLTRRTKEKREESDEYGTPKALYQVLHAEFDFTIDVAASAENHKHPNFITQERDALHADTSWDARNFCNPPYSNILPWYLRAVLERDRYSALTVFVSKFDPSTRHGKLANEEMDEIRVVEHRIKFEGATQTANFPSFVGVVRPRRFTRKAGPRVLYVDYREMLSLSGTL